MATNKFRSRQRAKQQRMEGNGGFVPINVAVEEYAREKQEELRRLKEEEEKKEAERKRVEEEIEAKLKKLYELSLECSELEFLRIDINSALTKKNINDILKYKKGAENTVKGRARYLGTSRSSLYRKKLSTLEQNGGSSLEKFGFVVKKADGIQKRKRDEVEENGLVANNSVALTTGQTGTLDDQLTTELYINDLEDIVDGSAVIGYKKEEELEDLSTTAKSVVEDDVDEMEALIPV
ncbi:hypothetical protein HMPREF1544_02162 [Mucor circinelloides 1006PhL]|uniref:Uncharacterized protein n=1 Tax=Mucor circinelloides f. circinelloides (strain 1006PhL) TaxID=1220926 RepID=S2KF19_MUCC1|nr:hypothetical protein HMPREF1544_02162 [Mucor circinelloides 1006PhL]